MFRPDPVQRYSHLPFPSYRYIPGKFPHPTRDPEGHSYNKSHPDHKTIDLQNWQQCEPYLYGVDLYNHEFWWEAHEAWESCWIATGKTTEAGLFIQGLIQIAAACLKKHQGHNAGATRLAEEGLAKFPTAYPVFLGIDTTPFKAALKDYFSGKRTAQPIIQLQEFQK